MSTNLPEIAIPNGRSARHRFRMALSRARVYRGRLTDAQLRCRERVQLAPRFGGRLSEMLSSLYYRSCGGM